MNATLPPVLAAALAPFAPRRSAAHQPQGYDDEMEQGCCSVCNGSGEGQFEGTRCYSCKGTGSDWYPVKRKAGPDDEQDEGDDFEGAPV